MISGVGPLEQIPRLLRGVRRPLRRLRTRRELQQQLVFARELLPELVRRGLLPGAEQPRIVDALLTRSAVVVLKLGQGHRDNVALLKLPCSPEAEASCARHHEVVAQLHQTPALQAFASLVPVPIMADRLHDRPCYLESVLPGQAAQEHVKRRADLKPLLASAAHAIGLLHTSSARAHTIDAAGFDRLVEAHLQLLIQFAADWPEAALQQSRLGAVRRLLERQLKGRQVSVGWIHGDFWLGNILIDASSDRLGGVVDWDRAVPDELPLHDVMHLVLYSRKLVRKTELGEEVVRSLTPSTDPDHALITGLLERQGLPTEPDFVRAAVLLYWLRFVAVNLARYPHFRRDMRWLKHNLFLVLQQDLS